MMASTRKKRKILEKNRSFQEKWTEQYLCIQSGGKALCLVCHETISVLKEYNIKRHYITKHKEYENMTGEARKEKISFLQKSLKGQQSVFTKKAKLYDASLKTSF